MVVKPELTLRNWSEGIKLFITNSPNTCRFSSLGLVRIISSILPANRLSAAELPGLLSFISNSMCGLDKELLSTRNTSVFLARFSSVKVASGIEVFSLSVKILLLTALSTVYLARRSSKAS